MYGTHRVLNNGVHDTSGGYARISSLSLNTGYNGGGQHTWIEAGSFKDANLGPINSITLWSASYPWYPTD